MLGDNGESYKALLSLTNTFSLIMLAPNNIFWLNCPLSIRREVSVLASAFHFYAALEAIASFLHVMLGSTFLSCSHMQPCLLYKLSEVSWLDNEFVSSLFTHLKREMCELFAQGSRFAANCHGHEPMTL